jgi:uncharacterized protein (DUF58 family)
LRRLDFTIIRRLDGHRQGDHRNLAYGAGLDLAELRPYVPGDDVRALDWNVTARMGEPYVRRFHEDRDVTVWLVLDLSASTDFGSGLQTKRELMVDVAGTLGRLLTSRGDRVGALIYTGSRVDEGSVRRRRARGARQAEWWSPYREDVERRPALMVPAGGGRTHVLHLLQRMMEATARVRASKLPKHTSDATIQRGTDLAALLEQAFATATQRSLVVVISDFLDGVEREREALRATPGYYAELDDPVARRLAGSSLWERALTPIARRHELIGVWVRDAREETLPDVGVVTFEDAETGEQVVADTSQPTLRAAYLRLAAERERRLERTFARLSANLWKISTAEPLVPALVTFLETRRRTAVGAQRLAVIGA